MSESAQQLARAIEASRRLVVVLTGAGISLASGIPTFRGSDPGAVWANDVTEMATRRYFDADPAGSWQWYWARFRTLSGALPNPAHYAVAALERFQALRTRDILTVTQNIDPLHERAGSARVIKVHGSADRCRCSNPMCRLGAVDSLPIETVDFTAFDADPREGTIPTCPLCQSLLRPHVLWFDEYYTSHAEYQWHVVDAALPRMGLLLCVGTSLAVGVTSMLQAAAARVSAPSFLIDPGERPADAASAMVHLRERAEEILPETVQVLNG